MTTAEPPLALPEGYADWLAQLKGQIAQARQRASLAVKAELVQLAGLVVQSNLKYMRFFAQHCPNGQFGQQPADQLPWFHIMTLLTQVPNAADREWYAAQTVRHGWSRSTLALHIKKRLLLRQGGAVTNFAARLPAPDSALAHEALKDPYLLTFLAWATSFSST